MQFNFVISTNTPAIRLWQGLGFKIVGTLPGAFRYPAKGYVDVYVMYRSLVSWSDSRRGGSYFLLGHSWFKLRDGRFLNPSQWILAPTLSSSALATAWPKLFPLQQGPCRFLTRSPCAHNVRCWDCLCESRSNSPERCPAHQTQRRIVNPSRETEECILSGVLVAIVSVCWGYR